jgi:hypothetical protein
VPAVFENALLFNRASTVPGVSKDQPFRVQTVARSHCS